MPSKKSTKQPSKASSSGIKGKKITLPSNASRSRTTAQPRRALPARKGAITPPNPKNTRNPTPGKRAGGISNKKSSPAITQSQSIQSKTQSKGPDSSTQNILQAGAISSVGPIGTSPEPGSPSGVSTKLNPVFPADQKSPRTGGNRTVIIGILAIAALIVIIGVIYLLWPSVGPKPTPAPYAFNPTSSPTIAESIPTVVTPTPTFPVPSPTPSFTRTAIPTNPSNGYLFTKGIPLDWSFGSPAASVGKDSTGAYWNLTPYFINANSNALLFYPNYTYEQFLDPAYAKGDSEKNIHKVGIFRQFYGTYKIKFSFKVTLYKENTDIENIRKMCGGTDGLCAANIFVGWGNPVPDDPNKSSGDFVMYRRESSGILHICYSHSVFQPCIEPDNVGIRDFASGAAGYSVELSQTENGRSIVIHSETESFQKSYSLPADSTNSNALWIGYDLRNPVNVDMVMIAEYAQR